VSSRRSARVAMERTLAQAKCKRKQNAIYLASASQSSCGGARSLASASGSGFRGRSFSTTRSVGNSSSPCRWTFSSSKVHETVQTVAEDSVPLRRTSDACFPEGDHCGQPVGLLRSDLQHPADTALQDDVVALHITAVSYTQQLVHAIHGCRQ
jgi:hypothetical protein